MQGSTRGGIAYQRAGAPSADGVPVLLLHAGVADRRMWDPQFDEVCVTHDVIRCDLRGFGDSTRAPQDGWSARGDVLDLLDELGAARVHLVGASFGAGVAVEIALERPAAVASLLLISPGGALIGERTAELIRFVRAEVDALDRGDLDAATDANVRWWVDGPGQPSTRVEERVRRQVRAMQRRAFEITAGWDDAEENDLDPPALERLGDVAVPTLILSGGLDLDAATAAADRLAGELPRARGVRWDDAAHMPSLERPGEALALMLGWFDQPDLR